MAANGISLGMAELSPDDDETRAALLKRIADLEREIDMLAERVEGLGQTSQEQKQDG